MCLAVNKIYLYGRTTQRNERNRKIKITVVEFCFFTIADSPVVCVGSRAVCRVPSCTSYSIF